MPMPEPKIFERIENELDQILDRTRRNYQDALEIIRDIEVDDLSPESREQLYGQIHAFREMVRILSPDFQKKLMVETAKLRRALSPGEVLRLLYRVDEVYLP
jgi:hypothetical protein